MSENQPFNNSSFNPASNSAFDKSQPIQGQAAPAPAAVAPVVMQPVKSTGVAYLLWFFLGGLGIHKFYLNQTALGVLYLCLFLGGFLGLFIIIGVIPLLVWCILMIIDIFLIPDRVNQMNGTSQVVQVVQQ